MLLTVLQATSWSRDPPLLCPTASSPYLATRQNSNYTDTEAMQADYAQYMRVVRYNHINCYV